MNGSSNQNGTKAYIMKWIHQLIFHVHYLMYAVQRIRKNKSSFTLPHTTSKAHNSLEFFPVSLFDFYMFESMEIFFCCYRIYLWKGKKTFFLVSPFVCFSAAKAFRDVNIFTIYSYLINRLAADGKWYGNSMGFLFLSLICVKISCFFIKPHFLIK